MGSASVTLVMPRTPIFGLEEVEPFPVPKRPAMMQQTPSVKIPLKQANKKPSNTCVGSLSGKIILLSSSPVDRMDRRGRGSRQSSTGIIIPNGLHNTCRGRTQHSQYPGNRYHRQPPLAYQRPEEIGSPFYSGKKHSDCHLHSSSSPVTTHRRFNLARL